jgi:magnesium chelatase subunit D
VVETEQARAAARLALPHRRGRNPFDSPGLDDEQLEQVLRETEPDDPRPDPDGPGGHNHDAPGDPGSDDPGNDDARNDAPGRLSDTVHQGAGPSADAGPDAPSDAVPGDSPEAADDRPNAAPRPPKEDVQRAAAPYRARLLTVSGQGSGAQGRRSRAITSSGRTIGARRPAEGEAGSPHLMATLMAAAPYQSARRTEAAPASGSASVLRLRHEDLRLAVREGREGNLVLFCVDASGSMGAKARMREVKTAILSLLLDAYQRRDKVGLVTFRGHEAAVALPPTTSVDAAATRLESMPTGGRTPLAEGLAEAARVVALEAVRDPRRRPLVVVVTDGRATAGRDAVARSRDAAALLARELHRTRGTAVVVDCEAGVIRLGLAASLAVGLGAEHLALDGVAAGATATTLTSTVRVHSMQRKAA